MNFTEATYINAINHVPTLESKEIFALFSDLKNGTTAEMLWHTHFKNDYPEIIPEQEWEKVLHENLSVLIHPDLLENSLVEPPLFPYPKLLTEIAAAPPILYVKGNPDLDFQHSLATVGSRKNTPYGRKVAKDIISTIAPLGIVIISGLALGIDALCHGACLEARGKTVAVLANGLDSVYPQSNKYIAQRIVSQNGAIVSEFPLGTVPRKEYFPRRNRIISGLAHGTLVIEAALKSGSMITAYRALQQNREVFAIPGDIYSKTSEGTNNLIAAGAKLVQSAEDLLEEFNLHELKKYGTKKSILES